MQKQHNYQDTFKLDFAESHRDRTRSRERQQRRILRGVLRRDFLRDLDFEKIERAQLRPYNGIVPSKLIAFNEISNKLTLDADNSYAVHFFLFDYLLAKLFPLEKSLPLFQRFQCVICPDFSQYADLPEELRRENSLLNKKIGIYWQERGFHVIPNAAWSTPDSYDHCFDGMPRESIVAVNSLGAKKTDSSKYLWRRGYEEMLRRLAPTKILRYGEKMPGENEEISMYFKNDRLIRLRNKNNKNKSERTQYNGRKW